MAPPSAWHGAFDLVVEVYTLQVLPPEVREKAVANLASFVSRGGTLLVVARGREASDDRGAMPWPLTAGELKALAEHGLETASFEDYFDDEQPPVRRFRVEYRRPSRFVRSAFAPVVVMPFLHRLAALSTGALCLWAATAALAAGGELVKLKYNNPGLVVDLGVGLWAWPVPCDADGDGDFDLIVSCPDKPSNGVWLFETASDYTRGPQGERVPAGPSCEPDGALCSAELRRGPAARAFAGVRISRFHLAGLERPRADRCPPDNSRAARQRQERPSQQDSP